MLRLALLCPTFHVAPDIFCAQHFAPDIPFDVAAFSHPAAPVPWSLQLPPLLQLFGVMWPPDLHPPFW